MLDVQDFITDREGDPKKIRENQQRRYAPEGVVDEVIALFEDHRKSESLKLRHSKLALTILLFSKI